VPAFPSSTVTSSTDKSGEGSSSPIVPTPSPSEIVALTAFVRLTSKVSLASSSVSPLTSIVTVFVVSPVRKVSWPLALA
jgi:hypothetical protein